MFSAVCSQADLPACLSARATRAQLDDAFAESVFPGCGGLAKLRDTMQAAEMSELDLLTRRKARAAALPTQSRPRQCA